METQYIVQDHGCNSMRKDGSLGYAFFGYGLGEVALFESKEAAENALAEFLGGYYNEKRHEYYIGKKGN